MLFNPLARLPSLEAFIPGTKAATATASTHTLLTYASYLISIYYSLPSQWPRTLFRGADRADGPG